LAGIDEELASAALDETLGADAEREAARLMAAGAASRPGATVDKVASRLARRGYGLPLALAVAREVMEAQDGSDPDPVDSDPASDD
jgi:SOS response regulatory protein OraA/RecX